MSLCCKSITVTNFHTITISESLKGWKRETSEINKRMPKIRTLFCLVHIKKRSFLTSFVLIRNKLKRTHFFLIDLFIYFLKAYTVIAPVNRTGSPPGLWSVHPTWVEVPWCGMTWGWVVPGKTEKQQKDGRRKVRLFVSRLQVSDPVRLTGL